MNWVSGARLWLAAKLLGASGFELDDGTDTQYIDVGSLNYVQQTAIAALPDCTGEMILVWDEGNNLLTKVEGMSRATAIYRLRSIADSLEAIEDGTVTLH